MISENKIRVEPRSVLDTNILISALIFQKGPPNLIFISYTSGFFHLCISNELIQELSKVLKQKFKVSDNDHSNLMRKVTKKAMIVESAQRITAIKTDPSDNRILECAVAAKVDYIVSGDKHLLSLKKYKTIRIIKASEFLKILSWGN